MLLDADRAKLENAKGMRLRVDMMCKDCIYDPEAPGTWRKQVESCTVSFCPLYAIRPTSNPRKQPKQAEK